MNRSPEIIKLWREWNAEQVAKGKPPEPFFSKWYDAVYIKDKK